MHSLKEYTCCAFWLSRPHNIFMVDLERVQFPAGILTGKSADVLDPTGTATRAEVATMLQRFISR